MKEYNIETFILSENICFIPNGSGKLQNYRWHQTIHSYQKQPRWLSWKWQRNKHTPQFINFPAVQTRLWCLLINISFLFLHIIAFVRRKCQNSNRSNLRMWGSEEKKNEPNTGAHICWCMSDQQHAHVSHAVSLKHYTVDVFVDVDIRSNDKPNDAIIFSHKKWRQFIKLHMFDYNMFVDCFQPHAKHVWKPHIIRNSNHH